MPELPNGSYNTDLVTPRIPMDIIMSAIEECRGLPSFIAKKLGVTRTTIYHWRDNIEAVEEALHDARESCVDTGIAALMKNVVKGKESSIQFLLRNWGRDRDFTDKQEHDLTSKGDKLGPAFQVVVEGDVNKANLIKLLEGNHGKN